MTADDIKDKHYFSLPASSATNERIKVIGVGGGGNNAINHMYRLGADSVSFIVANTDRQALSNSPVPTKVLLGPQTTRGRGAGNDPKKAHAAAEESAADIDALFDEDTDMVFVTAGMGGGTGTGASPVIARIAKERGILTIGIVTIPFLFEGQKKIIKALDGAAEMRKYVDALMIINNERLSEIYKDYDFLNAFGKADDILAMAAMSISEMVTCDGYINLDFNDVDTTLREGGTAIISTGYGEGENRVQKAIEDALHSPLLRNTDILGSRKLLFNLYFSQDGDQPFKIDETEQITEFISQIDPNVDVIWGVSIDNTLGNKVKFTILAAGFDVTISEGGGPLPPTHIHGSTSEQKNTFEKNEAEIEKQGRLAGEYGERLDKFNRVKTEQRYVILQPNQLDNDIVMEALEQHPTFNRDKRVNLTIKEASSTPASTVPQMPAEPQKNNTISFDDF
ncbi:MAG: cell division protein FtsZ [Muribaculaceae bacterium]|nr:cell division protein FtsZ [Muribaculaceae bacterium]